MTKISDSPFLNCDGKKLFFRDAILPVDDYHSPYCLVICDNNIQPGRYRDTTDSVVSRIEELIEKAKHGDDDEDEEYGYDEEGPSEKKWSKGGGGFGPMEEPNPLLFAATDAGGHLKWTNPRVWRSFHNPNVKYRCIELHTTQSWKVPGCSDELFKAGIPTAEFDIPYRERAIIDLQAEDKLWMLDTDGKDCELKVLAYDIETTQYDPEEAEEGDMTGRFPIDMIGWASFSVIYRAKRNSETGRCEFEMTSIPDWMQPKITQSVAHDVETEVENLADFIRIARTHHIIAGHNIMQFDNKQIYDRLFYLLNNHQVPAHLEREIIDFIGARQKRDGMWVQDRSNMNARTSAAKVFFYGEIKECVDFYPLSFDTLFAAKRLFFFLPEYNLKFLAKNFGYVIPDRVYLSAVYISIATPEEEARTLKYNEHDVREQIGITVHLLSDAMRLCHLTGLSFNDCMPAGTTKIWDTISFINSHRTRRIMPATVPAMLASTEIFHRLGAANFKAKKPWTKEELFEESRRLFGTERAPSPRTYKAIKYGIEAPDYVMYPHLVYNPYFKDVLHVLTSGKHACKECMAMLYLKDCRCHYCATVRTKFPSGLEAKGEQTAFITEELRKWGHKESDEMLADYVLNDRGFRNKPIGYHFPGGLTLHPSEVDSEFKMWWGLVVADVGSMYPSNLKAENIGGDTTRFADPRHYEFCAPKNIRAKAASPFRFAKEAYRWVWIKRVRADVVANYLLTVPSYELHSDPKYKELSKEFSFVDEGYLVAIVIDDETGGVSKGMGAVLDVTTKIKRQKEHSELADSGVPDRVKMQIANAYQSMKGLRNSGTHGILTAPTVSCRQFNLAGGARITTLGQCILDDVITSLDLIKARKVYGDSVRGDAEFIYKYDGIEHVTTFDKFWNENSSVGLVRRDGNDYMFLSGMKTESFYDNGEVFFDDVVFVTRHPYVGPLVKIATQSGKSVTVTPQHSIFTLRQCPVAVDAQLLRVGDDILSKMADKPGFIDLDKIVAIDYVIDSPDYVYDICVRESHRFFANGICAHNTDGIYMATSHEAAALESARKVLNLPEPGKFFNDPDLVKQTIQHINKKWQDILNYPSYELEIENHLGMLFVKHKNYIIIDHKEDKKTGKSKITIKTKGNNFKATDKAKVAMEALEGVIQDLIRRHVKWSDEAEERKAVKADIKSLSRKMLESINIQALGTDKLIMRQKVKPIGMYSKRDKPCLICNGTGTSEHEKCPYCGGGGTKLSSYAARANAIERLLFKPPKRLRSILGLSCVVCNNPLPSIDKPKKTASKPKAFMWPVEALEDPAMKDKCGGIDWVWYKNMVFNYIKGAFGFEDWNLKPWLCLQKQMTLDGKCRIKVVSGEKYAKRGIKAQGKLIECSDEGLYKSVKTMAPLSDEAMEILMSYIPDDLKKDIAETAPLPEPIDKAEEPKEEKDGERDGW